MSSAGTSSRTAAVTFASGSGLHWRWPSCSSVAMRPCLQRLAMGNHTGYQLADHRRRAGRFGRAAVRRRDRAQPTLLDLALHGSGAACHAGRRRAGKRRARLHDADLPGGKRARRLDAGLGRHAAPPVARRLCRSRCLRSPSFFRATASASATRSAPCSACRYSSSRMARAAGPKPSPRTLHWLAAGAGAGVLAMVKPYYAGIVIAAACMLALKRRDIRVLLPARIPAFGRHHGGLSGAQLRALPRLLRDVAAAAA